MYRTSIGWVMGLAVAALLAVGCGSDDGGDDAASVADGIDEVVRQVLTGTSPDAAPGHVLELSRVVIPAGEEIATHTHPGPQLAFIESGTLGYSIIEGGEVEVTRSAGTSDAEVETYGAGDTLELRTGDSILEPEGMVHGSSNDTDEPVIIYLSTLFQQGEPASSPADEAQGPDSR